MQPGDRPPKKIKYDYRIYESMSSSVYICLLCNQHNFIPVHCEHDMLDTVWKGGEYETVMAKYGQPGTEPMAKSHSADAHDAHDAHDRSESQLQTPW